MRALVTTPAILSFLIFTLVLGPETSTGAVIPPNTVWSGDITISEDVMVPPGVTLTIRPGSTVTVKRSESTKTDPEFISPLHEVMVRGRLLIQGTKEKPVLLRGETTEKESWGGIILADGGSLEAHHAVLRNAEAGISVFSGTAAIDRSIITDCRSGIVAASPLSSLNVADSSIIGNDYGVELIGAPSTRLASTAIRENRKGDRIDFPLPPFRDGTPAPPERTYPPRPERATVLVGDTVWSGRILIEHEVRIPEGSRLLISPGTVVEFRRIDSNRDGIGEAGLMVQGTIIARGTPAQPIRFLSAEKFPSRGDWDGISIMNSDGAQNIFEHCIFEDAYRPLHFHFSNVAISWSTMRRNMRGIQFQESIVSLKDSLLIDNLSGIQGRDSAVEMIRNRLTGNLTGLNFLRCAVSVRGCGILGNLREGGRIREGSLQMTEGVVTANRTGLLMTDLHRGEVARSILSGNATHGISMKRCDNLHVGANHIGSNGANGIALQESGGSIRGNLISGNGERGIGIRSFSGSISGNIFSSNRIAAVENEGEETIDARRNWWDGDPTGGMIIDGRLDPRRGIVRTDEWLSSPPTFVWPLQRIPTDTLLAGEVTFSRETTVAEQGVTLAISPGTRVRFGRGAGLTIRGKLLSLGSPSRPVSFSPTEGIEPGSWDEILLEHASGSLFRHSIVEGGTWGVHSHFTDLEISASLFRNNRGGVRFRSGPLRIRDSRFEQNGIGIRSYIGEGEIADSVITGNDIGIFVREGAPTLTIRGSDLSGNREYSIRLGDFNRGDLDARGNWWGEGNPSDRLFDGEDEEGIGRILWDPPLTSPRSPGG